MVLEERAVDCQQVLKPTAKRLLMGKVKVMFWVIGVIVHGGKALAYQNIETLCVENNAKVLHTSTQILSWI